MYTKFKLTKPQNFQELCSLQSDLAEATWIEERDWGRRKKTASQKTKPQNIIVLFKYEFMRMLPNH